MDILGKTKIWFAISGTMILISIVALLVWGLNIGIDFKGGSFLELQVKPTTLPSGQVVSTGEIGESLSSFNLKNLKISKTKDSIILRTETINNQKKDEIIQKLQEKFPKNQFTELRFETVGPAISKNLTKKAIIAVILACFAIVFYIAWAFHKVPKPASSFEFGICAILALIHDILIVVGIFSILGYFFKMEIDSLFITALLATMGFSVNDTIVVFDRIRSGLIKDSESDFKTIANTSVVNTLTRSINTSVTTLFVLLALLLLGGSSIRYFVLALALGIVVGTYSSIFVATPILVAIQQFKKRKTI